MKTNHPGQSVLYAYQSLSNDQKNWFSVKFLTDLSLESQVKEVQQSTLSFAQTNTNNTLDLPYSWSRCGCWSFYHFWSHSVSCSLSSHSQILKITSLYCGLSILPPHSNQGCISCGILDMSTWSKFGAHGEHGDVFLFSNLGALWFSENLIIYSLHVCLREVKNNLFSSKHSYLRHFSWRF